MPPVRVQEKWLHRTFARSEFDERAVHVEVRSWNKGFVPALDESAKVKRVGTRRTTRSEAREKGRRVVHDHVQVMGPLYSNN